MTSQRHAEALAALRAGRLNEARAGYEALVADDPADADALYHLAAVLLRQDAAGVAHETISRALALRPGEPRMHNALGQVHMHRKRYDDAEACFEAALVRNPRDPDAYANLGAALFERDRYEEAELTLRKALIHHPMHATACANLGRTLLRLHRPEEAVPLFHALVQMDPGDANAMVNIGIGCVLLGDLASAREALEQAIAHAPDNIEAHVNYAHLLLLEGEFEQGWREHEWRLRRRGYRDLDGFTAPMWDGDALAGRTVLLWGEQGLGDTLQFVRYAPLVAARGARVVVECHPALHRLVAGVDGVERVVALGEGDGYDLHVPLMSLPRHFGASEFPAAVPYLPVPPAADLGPRKGLRVGLAWAGNPRHSRDRERSRDLAEFAPLAELPGITFFALQYGEAARAAPPEGMELAELGSGFRDFADTAAAMAAVDLVISIDSAPAHLAGGLGIPVWVLLPRIPDWRWQLGRADSPWYPTMRLFREENGWEEVFRRVAAALSELHRRS